MPRKYVIDPAVARARGQLGLFSAAGNTEQVEQARKALALAKIEAAIARAVEQAPSLDADTIAKLHSLIPPAEVAEK